MDDDQRYLLDLQGFLHITGARGSAELARCRAAADRVVALEAKGGLPDGCVLEKVGAAWQPGDDSVGSHYDKVFSVEPALEALAFHPKVFPAVCELTDQHPKLRDGVLICDDNRINTPRGGTLHAAGEGDRRSARFEVADGRVYCDNFVVFFYFDDVRRGTAASLCCQTLTSQCLNAQRHSSACSAARRVRSDRSDASGRWLKRTEITAEQTLREMKWVGPLSAGDCVIMPESTTHVALPWQVRAAHLVLFSLVPQGSSPYGKIADFIHTPPCKIRHIYPACSLQGGVCTLCW